MSPYSDSELERMDRAAEVQAAREAFDAAHPEFAGLHPLFADLLLAHACVPAVGAALSRAAEKAGARRFSEEPEPITGFGPLDGSAS